MSWIRLLLEYRGSALSRVKGRLFAVFAVACAVTFSFEAYGQFTRDLTTTPFSLIGLALGVFLGFRNNASYDRYWEGRRLWGRIVNDTRSLTRLILHHVEADATTAPRIDSASVGLLQREMVHRVIAYAHALRMQLRNQMSELGALAPWLPAGELVLLKAQHNAALFIAHGLSGRLAYARRMGVLRVRDMELFETLISDLVDAQGGCERIRSTPIPWSYTVLIHNIVAVYCFGLPFGLVATTHLLTPIVVLLIAYAFLGLDAVGDELEEPFGLDLNDLPLESITRTIEVNLRQLLGDTDLPPLLVPDAHRVLS